MPVELAAAAVVLHKSGLTEMELQHLVKVAMV
jgi:hypothetical protein